MCAGGGDQFSFDEPDSGYFRTEDMKPTMVQNLRAILQRAGFTKDEIDVLHGVIGAFERLPGKYGRDAGG